MTSSASTPLSSSPDSSQKTASAFAPSSLSPQSNHISSSVSAAASSSALPSQTSSPAIATSVPLYPQWNVISKRLAVNMQKFFVITGSHCPTVNTIWQNALQNVNADWRRVLDHESLAILRGYPFPDPTFLAKDSNMSYSTKVYLLGWLALRPGWLARLADATVSPPSYPNPQQWKDVIKIDVGRALNFAQRLKSTEDSSNKRQKKEANVKDALGIDWSALRSSVDIFWKGHLLCSSGSTNVDRLFISTTVLKEVIWDLMEHNFRFELLALDRSIFPRARLSEHAATARDEMVAACLPNQTFVSLDWPVHDEGLGARKWEDRMEFVEAFRILLVTWPGSAAQMLQGMTAIQRHSGSAFTGQERLVEQVEQVAYPFYCQTFFNYFARAPSVPHNRPS